MKRTLTLIILRQAIGSNTKITIYFFLNRTTILQHKIFRNKIWEVDPNVFQALFKYEPECNPVQNIKEMSSCQIRALSFNIKHKIIIYAVLTKCYLVAPMLFYFICF